MSLPNNRLPGIDALKGLACVMIVWHHLAFYGPMSDVIYPLLPSLTDWLYDYGRMAVQVFLVVSGFLVVSSLTRKGGATCGELVHLVWRRYCRLVLPYLVALVVTILVAALVRPWFDHPSVPDAPTWGQLAAHVLLLQDVLNQESLSAGAWYVAIDFQLFAMSVLIFGVTRKLQARRPEITAWPGFLGIGLVLILAALSLFFFNRQEDLDVTGLYFFGSYALGMLTFWALNTFRRGLWLLLIALLGGAALVLDFRGRLVVALAVAFGLVGLSQSAILRHSLQQRWLMQLGRISYSVFLVHFPVCLLVNAVVSYFWPTQVLVNALGLLAAFLLSLLAGAVLYRGVESRGIPSRRLATAGISAERA